MRVLLLGASGSVGRLIMADAAARGWRVRAQTRDAGKLDDAPAGVEIVEFHPTDPEAMARSAEGCDAVIFALGVDHAGETTLFSDATRALIAAMKTTGARRLVAITGVGAGETRGHGGWFYDHVIFPLFTRKRYADKERQEALIRESGLDWTILRPAAFSKTRDASALEVHARVARDLRLRSITREEAARCAVDLLENDGAIGQTLFVGRP